MKTTLLKLISGQEIVGRVHEETADFVILEEIRAIRVVPQANNQYGIELVPFSPTLPQSKWKYNKSVILGEALELPDALVKYYDSVVSGIEIVSSLSDQILQK